MKTLIVAIGFAVAALALTSCEALHGVQVQYSPDGLLLMPPPITGPIIIPTK